MTNLPVTGTFEVTATFGQTGPYWKNGHKGIDLIDSDHRIFATCDGKVRVIAFDEGGWGQYVTIGDSNNRIHIFCHLEKGSVKVKIGQQVNRSTIIGTMGSTGNSTGRHLHYQLENTSGKLLNPAEYMGIPNKIGKYNSKDYEIGGNVPMFKDEDKIPSWAKTEVDALHKKGIITGDEKGNWNGDKPMTRNEAAVIIYRALGFVHGYDIFK